MRIHTGEITQTDRISLSNDLYALADALMQEAERWAVNMRPLIERGARHLADLARHALNERSDFAVLEAYHDAGHVMLREVAGRRHLIDAVTIKPNTRARKAL